LTGNHAVAECGSPVTSTTPPVNACLSPDGFPAYLILTANVAPRWIRRPGVITNSCAPVPEGTFTAANRGKYNEVTPTANAAEGRPVTDWSALSKHSSRSSL
jgi:hypothetical protein